MSRKIWASYIAVFAAGMLLGGGLIYVNSKQSLPGAPSSASSNAARGDVALAQESLQRFFFLLNSKEYSEAAKYFGGDYSQLTDWNPSTDPSDHASLFKSGCEMNGLNCLKAGPIIDQKQVSPTEFSFKVMFMNEDGSTFEQGLCCGEEPTPGWKPTTTWDYTVKKVGNDFLVMGLPPYTP